MLCLDDGAEKAETATWFSAFKVSTSSAISARDHVLDNTRQHNTSEISAFSYELPLE